MGEIPIDQEGLGLSSKETELPENRESSDWVEDDGKQIHQEHDSNGLLRLHEAKRFRDGAEASSAKELEYHYRKEFEYDEEGRMTQEAGNDFHRDHAYTTTFEYDSEGRLTVKTVETTAGENKDRKMRIEFIYDEDGNQKGERGEILATGANEDHERQAGHTWEKSYE